MLPARKTLNLTVHYRDVLVLIFWMAMSICELLSQCRKPSAVNVFLWLMFVFDMGACMIGIAIASE